MLMIIVDWSIIKFFNSLNICRVYVPICCTETFQSKSPSYTNSFPYLIPSSSSSFLEYFSLVIVSLIDPPHIESSIVYNFFSSFFLSRLYIWAHTKRIRVLSLYRFFDVVICMYAKIISGIGN